MNRPMMPQQDAATAQIPEFARVSGRLCHVAAQLQSRNDRLRAFLDRVAPEPTMSMKTPIEGLGRGTNALSEQQRPLLREFDERAEALERIEDEYAQLIARLERLA